MALESGVHYNVEATEVDGPDFCVGDEGIGVGYCSGVTFNFMHDSVIRKSLTDGFFYPSQLAEILFKPIA